MHSECLTECHEGLSPEVIGRPRLTPAKESSVVLAQVLVFCAIGWGIDSIDFFGPLWEDGADNNLHNNY